MCKWVLTSFLSSILLGCIDHWCIEHTAVSAISTGDSIYFSDRTAHVYKISKDGEVIWEISLGLHGDYPPPLLGNNDKLYLVSKGIFTIDMTSGKAKKHELKNVCSICLFRDYIVILDCGSGEVYAIEPDSGEVEWKKKVATRPYFAELIPHQTKLFLMGEEIYEITEDIKKIPLNLRGCTPIPTYHYYPSYPLNSYQFPSPSSYIWFRCPIPFESEIGELERFIRLNPETYEVFSTEITPKFDVARMIREAFIFWDKIIVYSENEHENDIISAQDITTGELIWRREIKAGFLIPLTDAVVSITPDYKRITTISLLSKELWQKETSINMNFEGRYGTVVAGKGL